MPDLTVWTARHALLGMQPWFYSIGCFCVEGDGHTVNDGRRRHQFLNSRSIALHAGLSVRMARIAWAVERNRAFASGQNIGFDGFFTRLPETLTDTI